MKLVHLCVGNSFPMKVASRYVSVPSSSGVLTVAALLPSSGFILPQRRFIFKDDFKNPLKQEENIKLTIYKLWEYLNFEIRRGNVNYLHVYKL